MSGIPEEKLNRLEVTYGRRAMGWRWWVRLGAVVLTSVGATLLILLGAVRYLGQAQQEHDRVECLRQQVKAQASGNALMATQVLDARLSQAERAGSVARWRDDQARIAELIGRC